MWTNKGTFAESVFIIITDCLAFDLINRLSNVLDFLESVISNGRHLGAPHITTNIALKDS